MSKFHRAELLAGIVAVIACSSSRAVDQKAVDRAIGSGVQALRGLQEQDGTWPHKEIGASALAGLTLLECGVKADDRAVLRAADVVRMASPTLTYNYSICLAILFLDRLGDANDIPLIESLTVRLLAGQTASGGWTYRCPMISEAEVRRLQGLMGGRNVLVGRREMPKPGSVKRSAKDLPKEIQQQLAMIQRMGGGSAAEMLPSDNSNTQFATLALWIARRYGLPVETALKRVQTRFRNMQNANGGWGYRDPGSRSSGFMSRSTASMTCAGLLGLAVYEGEVSEKARERNARSKQTRDINKDTQVRRGLLALSTTIGKPAGANGPRQPAGGNTKGRPGAQAPMVPRIGGRTYYFLWSLERVAVALDLKTIGQKDWYDWGAEILLDNQQDDGSWQGSYGDCGADTCFALLFLKRANLVPDLTTQLTGRLKDPGERVLKRGELGEGIGLEKSGDLDAGIEDKNTKPRMDGQDPAETAKETPSPSNAKTKPTPTPTEKPPQSTPLARADPATASADKPRAEKKTPDSEKKAADDALSTPAGRMAADLARSIRVRHDVLLRTYRDGKGAEFSEALALAIPQLNGERQRKVREALAERLTRMKDSTLIEYLKDENMEIRIAAARACAVKRSKALIPNLIPLVRETRGGVAEAAHRALKDLSGQDFGPNSGASREERVQAARQWSEWWKMQEGK
ncbi:MAG: prenyltransferase/squalene oxidase repeat-containing protein [Gemmataceae bacterium]